MAVLLGDKEASIQVVGRAQKSKSNLLVGPEDVVEIFDFVGFFVGTSRTANRSAGGNLSQGRGLRRGRAGGTAKSEARWIWFKFTRLEGFLVGGRRQRRPDLPDAPHRTALPSWPIASP